MTKQDHVVGRYRLKPGHGLIAGGETVHVGAKALDILTVLIEAGGDLVTKDELLDQIWPGIVVEEHNIQVHVSALRKALGDEAGWIVTVSKRGYRFVGPSSGSRTEAPFLPRPIGRLFGREEELVTIRSLLERARLVTIAGPGGIGKTRIGLELAREIAGRYRDGAVFIDLSVLQDPSLVPSLVATTLGTVLNGDEMIGQLVRRLRDREMLILLDNCEHVVDAIAPLAERILVEAPGISLLATSREPLACLGEQVYRLPLLPVPEVTRLAKEALMSPAVALLVDRLEAADLRFKLTDASAEAASIICRRLDGLPLAIEMVGALAPGLGLEALAAKLELPFSLPYSITRTIAPRHRSLEATLDWSHALLSPAEKVLLRRLSVFPGPFSLAAVEAVLGGEELPGQGCGDLLARLVRKSLVSIDATAVSRSYRMLETIRTYAAEKLDEADERNLLHARHAEYVIGTLDHATREWKTATDSVWSERYLWLLADLRVALRWSFGPDGDISLGLGLAGLSRQIWHMLNLNGEGRRWAEAAAAELTADTPPRVAAFVWAAIGSLTGVRSFERTIPAWRKAVELFGQTDEVAELGSALVALGQMLTLSGQTTAGGEVLERADALIDSHTGNRRLGMFAMTRAMLHSALGSWSEATRQYERALPLFQAAGAVRSMTVASYNLADMLWAEGAHEAAIGAFRATVELGRRSGPRRTIGLALGSLAGVLVDRGDLDAALAAAGEAVPILREDELIDWLFPHLALRLAKAGRPEDAARLWGYAERVIGKGVVRQKNERRAAEALEALLRATIPSEQREGLVTIGRHLSEDQAVALALDPQNGVMNRTPE
ncbi:MAG TPA: winged helix-turn-helix domain-containing protein [Aliidongia sp.]|nr:winged helix-turn-helix domain-containing protein [Aliidongia sp.]